jgi:hypothetical protein
MAELGHCFFLLAVAAQVEPVDLWVTDYEPVTL